jgi:nucleoside-diphosphate-sugar epimerase
MRILVTGSEGSLAQLVIPEFQKAGHEIVGADNFARYGFVDRDRTYEFIRADLSDSQSIMDLVKQCQFEAIFHAAALVYGVVGFHDKPADIVVDNNLMTMNLLKHAADKIERFVYLSSSMVYERCSTLPHKEDDADSSVVMSTSYGLSKYIGERVVKAFHHQYGTNYTIWRPFNIITPFEKPEEEGVSHVFSDMIRKIIIEQQKPLRVLGDGEQIRCFTNIHDVAEAIAKFSFAPQALNQVFNVANREPVTVKELIALIVQIGKAKGILDQDYEVVYEYLPTFSDDVKKRIPDVSKMKETFAWTAKNSVSQSLEQCIDYHWQRSLQRS